MDAWFNCASMCNQTMILVAMLALLLYRSSAVLIGAKQTFVVNKSKRLSFVG